MHYPVVKTKALISYAIGAWLICAFGFAYADCWFTDAAAQVFKTYIFSMVPEAKHSF